MKNQRTKDKGLPDYESIISFFLIPVILLVIFPSISSSAPFTDITRQGRKIQLDGFLMDWLERNRQPLNGSAVWSWDAINTEEGVAGYLHAENAAVCSTRTFDADVGRGSREMVVSAGNPSDGNFYRVNLTAEKNRQSLTVEWLFTWDSVATDSNGVWKIAIASKNTCGELYDTLFLTGKREMSAKSPLPNGFGARMSLIIVLLVVFVALQVVVRKRPRRRE